jgi:hypothetical protein
MNSMMAISRNAWSLARGLSETGADPHRQPEWRAVKRAFAKQLHVELAARRASRQA